MMKLETLTNIVNNLWQDEDIDRVIHEHIKESPSIYKNSDTLRRKK